MAITYYCQCGHQLVAEVTAPGTAALCPACGSMAVVPAVATVAGQPAAPPPLAPPVVRAPATAKAPTQPAAITSPFATRYELRADAQVVPNPARCVQCGICSHNCPMGIDVRAHAWRGRPIHDSRCLTCSECVNRCPRGVLQFEKLALFEIEA